MIFLLYVIRREMSSKNAKSSEKTLHFWHQAARLSEKSKGLLLLGREGAILIASKRKKGWVQMASRTASISMTEGPLGKSVLRFAIPVMLTGILQLLYNAADLIVVGQFAENGELALAAVGSSGPLINLIVNFFMGLALGTGVTLAIALGSGNRSVAERVTHTSMTMALILGVAVGAIGLIFSPTFLRWMDTPSDVLDGAIAYLRIYFIGVPAIMLYNYGATVVRTTGDTKTPLLILTASGLLNVLLNLVTVVFFGMAEEGVAIATVASNYASAIAVILYQMRSRGPTRLYLSRLRIDPGLFVRILRCGVPAGIQSSVFSFSNVLLQSAVNSLGSTIVAGCVASGNLDGFIYTAQNAFYHATLTFTGQNVGAKKYERIGLVMRWGFLYSMLTWFVTGGIMLLFGEKLIALYIPGKPEAIAPGMQKLIVLATTYFLCGLNEVVVGASRGMGASLSPMVASIVGICGVRSLWALVIFPLNPTVTLLYCAFPVSWGLTFLIQIPINRQAKRHLIKSGKTVLS